MKSLWISIRLLLWMTVLTGIIYPLLITAIGYTTMKHNAAGSFVEHDGKVVGSNLIAQKFESDKYFWPRPSANDYNGLSSGGSNLGPTSAVLKKSIEDRKAAILRAHGISDASKIPSELLFASGSGLDPDISPETAEFQLDRIAKARGLKKEALSKLVKDNIQNPLLNFLGPACVNVLKLNIALDQLQETSTQKETKESKTKESKK